MNFEEIINDLKRGAISPALTKRAAAAIEELVQMRQLDQAELIRLRRWIERLEEDK